MCYGCYEEYGKPSIVNSATRQAAQLIRKVYEFCPSGGAAHIVIDDWNIEDEHVDWCLDEGIKWSEGAASKEQVTAETKCLQVLRSLSLEERASALAIHDEFLVDSSSYPATRED